MLSLLTWIAWGLVPVSPLVLVLVKYRPARVSPATWRAVVRWRHRAQLVGFVALIVLAFVDPGWGAELGLRFFIPLGVTSAAVEGTCASLAQRAEQAQQLLAAPGGWDA